MKILTFVIPAYNSRQFLEKCVQSMVLPELLDKLEIIIVNDGSTDETAQIAERLCAKYPNTVLLISQTNKGHGGALNTGCAAATGKYLKVVDADDWVRTENLPAFLAALERCESDVVLTHHRTVDISTGEIRVWKSFPKAFDRVFTLADVDDNWTDFERSMTFHGITYRTAFYQSSGCSLAEKVFYEDHEYATFPCSSAASICPLDLAVYDYRIGDVNQSVSQVNQLRRLGHMETVMDKMTESMCALPDGPGRRYAARKLQGVMLSYLTTVLLVEPDRPMGKARAAERMELCRSRCPEVFAMTEQKYRVFVWMNRLHISKNIWDKVLTCGLYRILRGKRKFE